jgi:hypothetical protein
MTTTMQDRAAKGAAILDEKELGWADRVDEKVLSERSVLVQLFGAFRDGSAITRLLAPHHKGDVMAGWAMAPEFGFALAEQRHRRSLAAAWQKEVMDRKHEAAT